MKCPRARLGFTATSLLLLVLTTPATAQYMYLDSNGDGVHTAADQVNPAGATTIDIWLDTDNNRDGSPSVCTTSSDSLTLNSYTFSLRAENGTMSWGLFTNRQPTMAVHFLTGSSSTEYFNGYGGITSLPPGTYRLGTLIASVASGSPQIQIVPSTAHLPPLPPNYTNTTFGSKCDGRDFDSTLKLGSDWFDIDGLPFGSVGSPNSAPVLTQPADMNVATGETAFQILTAADGDHQPVAFSKTSGPAYAAVATQDVGSGTATGTVFLAPSYLDEGTTNVTIAASDGITSDQKTFGVAVHAGPNHTPAFAPNREIVIAAGAVGRHQVPAADADGQPLAFLKAEGPDYLDITTLSPGNGGAVGSMRLSPGPCDAGTASAVVNVTDGISSDFQSIGISVRFPKRASPPQSIPVQSNTNSVAVGDLNRDGCTDAVIAGGLSRSIVSVLLGRCDGTHPSPQDILIAGRDPSSVALGDLDGDGDLDLTVTDRGDAILTILNGRGDGTFGDPRTHPTGPRPEEVRIVDLDRDGALDLIVSNGSGISVSVHRGQGDGTFGTRRDFEVGRGPFGVAIADFDGDGRLDLATANFLSRSIGILLGFGDGTFGDRREIPFVGPPFAIEVADWNWDGIPDLAVSDWGRGRVAILIGDGEGNFSASSEIDGLMSPQDLAVDDLNGDGNLDLVIADPSVRDESLAGVDIAYGRGNGTFDARRRLWSLNPSMAVATGDANVDGLPDIVAAGWGDVLRVWLNDNGSRGPADARAFQSAGSRVLPNSNAGSTFCLRLEPVNDSYRNSDLDLTSLTLSSTGTGSIDQISAIEPKSITEGDSDRNGVAELPACFARADFARLIDQVRGRQTITARLEGATTAGRRFCAKVDLEVVGTGGPLTASVSPNPLNPRATLRFTTSRNGFVRARMYDLQGRVVRSLLDRPLVEAGTHEVLIDGRAGSGERLASGIYFYEVDASEGRVRGRLTILK